MVFPEFLRRVFGVAVLCVVLSRLACAEERPRATLDWVEKAYGDGRHNAFTDLAIWRGEYYLCFRHGASHGSMDGEIRILRSADMHTWEPCGTLDTMGDDRDPHFVVTPEVLYVYFGVWDLEHGQGHAPTDRGSIRSHMASTHDGRTWSKVQAIYEPRWWVWRVIHHEGRFYGVAYTAYRPKPDARETRLLTSEDGLEWTFHATIATERMPTESAMWFESDQTIRVISRMADTANEAFLFRSDSSLKQWTGGSTGAVIHSPAVAHWHDRIFVAGRGKAESGWVTRVWELMGERAVELITLPSSGDTAYPGLLTDPASLEGDAPALFVSWYSQHESADKRNTASVYVTRVSIQP